MTQDDTPPPQAPLSLRAGSTDTASVQTHYDGWAESYDRTLADWHYQAPKQAAALLSPWLSAGARVLDVGCGTGLFGAALAARGRHRIGGIDISQASLDQAEERDCYSALHRHDLQDLPLPVADGHYDAAACVGVLTYIAETEALMRDLCRALRPGGTLVFTQRSDLWAARDMQGMIQRLQHDGLWLPQHISAPQPYLPGHEDFGEEIQVIFAQCQRL